MPKVTEAYRESRRDEIAQATMRCVARNGFGGTSMADIIAESGMSAGSIYSHFASKAEIAGYVARIIVGARGEQLAIETDQPMSPADIIAAAIEGFGRAGVPTSLLLQIWAEATVHEELHQLVDEAIGQLRQQYGDAVRPWLRAQRGATVTDADVAATASTMITLSQGYIAHSALFGDGDPRRYLASAAMLLR